MTIGNFMIVHLCQRCQSLAYAGDKVKACQDGCLVVHENVSTLSHASSLRSVSGDIVVDGETREIIKDTGWLWNWERDLTQPTKSYAMRMIQTHKENR